MSSRGRDSKSRPTPLAKLPRRLAGRRVVLRYPTERDRATFMRLKLASRAFLEAWEPTPLDGTDLFSEIVFDNLLKTRRSELHHRFVICLRGRSPRSHGPIIGQISLGNIVRSAFQSCYVGYWIGARYAGRGYMTEALRLVLRFAFEDLGLHRLEANIIGRNVPSKALVRKLGFRYEGTAKRYLRIAGRWQDHEHWAITREEWPPIRLKDSPPKTARRSTRSRSR